MDLLQRTIENRLVEERERIESLILSGWCDVLVDRQVREETRHVGLSHLRRMALIVEQYEPSNPVDVSVLCTDAVVSDPNGLSDSVEKPRRTLAIIYDRTSVRTLVKVLSVVRAETTEVLPFPASTFAAVHRSLRLSGLLNS